MNVAFQWLSFPVCILEILGLFLAYGKSTILIKFSIIFLNTSGKMSRQGLNQATTSFIPIISS
jgi:hypothetical protein